MAPLPDQIGGYKVIHALGKGGMGAVYLAQDPAIGRLVAIKLLREGLDNPELRERFAREARSAGRLRHPNIVTLFHVGEHDSQPYIVMEYIPGDTLADIIQQRLPLSVRHKLRIIEDLCRGLAHAHKSGVVHRDIKPANVLVDSEGIVKILDFGIARIGEQEMTRLGMMMGTPNYMSPEQINPGTSDHRSDVFAVGLVLYELLAYKRAFPGDSFSVLHNIVNGQPDPIETLVTDLDSEVVAILRRSLQKSPDHRYQDIGAMRIELARVRGRLRFASASDDSSDEGPITPVADTGANTDTPTVVARPETQIALHVSLARQALEARQYERAVTECDLALALESGNSDAAQLKTRARQQLDLAASDNLLAAARAALAEGRISTAIESLARAEALGLTADPAASWRDEIAACHQEIEAARQRAERVRIALDEGWSHLRVGNLDAARGAIEDAKRAGPDDEDVSALEFAVADATAEHERQVAEEMRRREEAAREQSEREQAEREQAAREQAAREQAAREQAEREQAEREQAEREQAAREQAEREQAAREQAEREQAEREQAEREQAAREQAAREQAAREQAEREQAEREQAAREQAAREQAAREQAAREQAEREQAAREQAEREQAEREQAAREQAAREQAAREQAAREQAAREQAEREQAAREQAEREQAAREQAEREQAAREQAAREQAARKQAAREQAAREQAARKQAAREQAEREQAAREQAAREQAARKQAAREQAEREQAAREQAEREQAALKQAAREQAAREQAARKQAARDQAAREQAARDQAAREQAARDQQLDENVNWPIESMPSGDETIVLKRAPQPAGAVAPKTVEPKVVRDLPPAPPAVAPRPGPSPEGMPRSIVLAAVAAIAIVIGAIVWMSRSGGGDETARSVTTVPAIPTTSTVPAAAPSTTPPAASSTVAPAASTTAPSISSAAPTTPTTAPAQNPQAATLHQELTTALGRGDTDRAVRLLASAPARVRSDAAIERDIDQLFTLSRTSAAQAQQRVPKPNTASNDYRQAVQQQSQGESLGRSGRKLDGASALLEAAQLFARAAAASQTVAVPTTSSVPAAVAPTTVAPTTSSVAATTSSIPPPTTIPPPPASGPTPAQDTAAIRTVLQRFVEGYRALDLEAIRRVHPSTTANFRDARAYEIELSDVEIALQGNRATVSCRRYIRQTNRSGRPNESTVPTVFGLRREPGGWIIESVR